MASDTVDDGSALRRIAARRPAPSRRGRTFEEIDADMTEWLREHGIEPCSGIPVAIVEEES